MEKHAGEGTGFQERQTLCFIPAKPHLSVSPLPVVSFLKVALVVPVTSYERTSEPFSALPRLFRGRPGTPVLFHGVHGVKTVFLRRSCLFHFHSLMNVRWRFFFFFLEVFFLEDTWRMIAQQIKTRNGSETLDLQKCRTVPLFLIFFILKKFF